MDTDIDIFMAYNQLRDKSIHKISHEWVMGHADEKCDKKSDVKPFKWDNIEYDKEADDLVKSMEATGEQAQPFKPLPGYKAMLQLRGNCATTHSCKYVEFANTSPKMVNYAVRPLDISLGTFYEINWSASGKVRSCMLSITPLE